MTTGCHRLFLVVAVEVSVVQAAEASAVAALEEEVLAVAGKYIIVTNSK